jgi:NTE family protein
MVSKPSATKEKEHFYPNGSAFECVALLLQGGGALGAYQAGVYEALAEAGIAPEWVGGISMGAINGAIIAGNKPSERIGKLRGFWQSMTAPPLLDPMQIFGPFIQRSGETVRTFWDQASAYNTTMKGVSGFFTPRLPPAWLSPPGSPTATSFYDTKALKKTLEQYIDFDVLNTGAVRYTTSAVSVRSGNYAMFDTLTQRIGPEHIMASGALPPGLPAIEIEGQYYWDGGLISNTPLQWVMNEETKNTLVFQVDLWSARGEFPKDILGVMTRQKEIQYSSRTREMTDHFKHTQKLRHAYAALYKKLPENLKKTKEAELLMEASDSHVYNIVHLIYRAKGYEGYSKDCEFSQLSMSEHWKAGYDDTVRSLRHKEILKLPTDDDGIMTYDLTKD